METTVFQRLKETISQRVQNISEFLNSHSANIINVRIGPADRWAVESELTRLDMYKQKAEDQTLGLCEVCHEHIETSRLEMDYTACVCLEHLSGEERAILENDLELSAKVQQALLPQILPQIRNVEIAAYSQPARIVSGDYFDFLKFKDNTDAIIVADVMGKGMPASMLMASLQASLRIIIPENNQPSEVMSRLNHIFCHNIRLTHFVTLIIAKYNEQLKEITYCNAGHNSPVVLKTNGNLILLEPTGAAIGLIEQTVFEQRNVLLEKGDTLFIYTDGVVESFNPQKEMFGQERLEEFLRTSSKNNSQQIISGLKETITRFTKNAPPSDDTTIIAMNIIG